jgi:hypothetical protein
MEKSATLASKGFERPSPTGVSLACQEPPQPEACPIDLFTSPVDLLSHLLALSALCPRRPFVSFVSTATFCPLPFCLSTFYHCTTYTLWADNQNNYAKYSQNI